MHDSYIHEAPSIPKAKRTTSKQAQAPSKPLYRKIFRQHRSKPLTAMFATQVTPPAELEGLIGMDQFSQRDLSPSTHVGKHQVQQWLKLEPVEFQPVVITTSLLRSVFRQSNRFTPFRDVLWKPA